MRMRTNHQYQPSAGTENIQARHQRRPRHRSSIKQAAQRVWDHDQRGNNSTMEEARHREIHRQARQEIRVPALGCVASDNTLKTSA